LFLLALALAFGAGIHFFGWRAGLWFGHWQSVDIGPAGLPGTYERQGDRWNIGGSGADIWGQSDAFHFVCRPASSEASLTARVLGIEQTDPWAKAGVMIRDSLAPDAPYAMVLLTPNSGLAFQLRAAIGTPATSLVITQSPGLPCWVRLVRHQNTFAADYSSDGKAWASLGSTVIPMQENAWAGLAVTAHNYSALCRSSFDQVNIKGIGPNRSAAKAASPAAAKDIPPTDDHNWLLVLNGRSIPDSPVAGRIHNQDFRVERASFQNSTLMLRAGQFGSDFGATIDFSGASADQLAGKTINVTTNAAKAAKVTLYWPGGPGSEQLPSYATGYALRLQFGNFTNDRLSGKIYLCLPDPQKSYLLGSFDAQVAQPKTP
jgi:regulation of enolase protein 1 (concanavalin A-like superfamily)